MTALPETRNAPSNSLRRILRPSDPRSPGKFMTFQATSFITAPEAMVAPLPARFQDPTEMDYRSGGRGRSHSSPLWRRTVGAILVAESGVPVALAVNRPLLPNADVP